MYGIPFPPKCMVWIRSSSHEFYTQVEYFISLFRILYALSRFEHPCFIFVIQVLHSRLALIHFKLHATHSSFMFHIANSTKLFVVQVLHLRLALITFYVTHSSFMFHITNSTTFIFNSTSRFSNFDRMTLGTADIKQRKCNSQSITKWRLQSLY